MAKKCPNCGKRIPKFIWVDGKKRNFQRRRYCLTCSPFGQHNTKQLEKPPGENNLRNRICPKCGKEHRARQNTCYACYFRRRQKQVSAKVEKAIGGFRCWICGYDKTKRNLCFHHIDESTKSFCLSTREFVGYSWERVWAEIQKCILVCMNCHGEIHAGLIHSERVKDVFQERPRKGSTKKGR